MGGAWRGRLAIAAIAMGAGLFGLAGAACGQEGRDAAADLAPAFGNAIVSTHPDGRQARLWLNRDATYAAQGRRGERSGGVWTLKGDKLCLRQRRPIPIPFPYCKAFPRVHVGSVWSDTAFNGDKVTNRLAAGH
jgi:hypothetical protein